MKNIETKRLVLRPMTFRDSEDIHRMLSDRDTAWWADMPVMRSHMMAFDFIRWGNRCPDIEQYGITEKDGGSLVGFIQVKLPGFTGETDAVELGYVLSRDHRRKGYMGEAVEAVCDKVFRDPSVREITLEILPDNDASRGVARHCGFEVRPVENPELRYLDGRPLDRHVLDRERFANRKAA